MTREDEIFKKLKQGDGNAPEELVKLYYPEILRYCLWHAPDRMAAEDAVQETFLKAIRFLDRYEHKGKFRPFLYQIAANTCVDEWRKKKAEPLPEEVEFTEPEFFRAEAEVDFRLLVERLPEEWKDGKISGGRAPGGITIDFVWKDRCITECRLQSQTDMVRILLYNGIEKKVMLKANTICHIV